MKSRWTLVVMVILACSLIVSAGCAKKTTSTTPPGAQVEVKDDSNWAPEPESIQEPKVDEAALAAERAAVAEADAVQELSNVTIHFAFDSYELDEEARSILAIKANIMRQFKNVNVVIEGHCDERGTEEYNLALGERRARASYEHLVILGVAPERMSIVSFGEEHPVDPGHNETAWVKNRRADFVVQ